MAEVELGFRALMWAGFGIAALLASYAFYVRQKALTDAMRAPVYEPVPVKQPVEQLPSFEELAPDLDPTERHDIQLARLTEFYEAGIVPKYMYDQAKVRIDEEYLDRGGEIGAES